MANEEHLARLKEAIAAKDMTIWNHWRQQNQNPFLNLHGADLSGANLTDANLSGAILMGANLSETDLTKANLSGTILTRANLAEANLTAANLTEANLSGTILVGANLEEANLTKVNLTEADLLWAKGLLQEQIRDANGNKDTKLPPHLRRPENWDGQAQWEDKC